MPTTFDIDEIVRRTVAEAIRTGDLLRVNHEAWRIAAETGLSRREIARDLFEAGIAARINMEIGERPRMVTGQRSEPEGPDAGIRSDDLMRIELKHHRTGLAVELSGGHGAEAVSGLEQNDAGHEGGGEAEGVFAGE